MLTASRRRKFDPANRCPCCGGTSVRRVVHAVLAAQIEVARGHLDAGLSVREASRLSGLDIETTRRLLTPREVAEETARRVEGCRADR